MFDILWPGDSFVPPLPTHVHLVYIVLVLARVCRAVPSTTLRHATHPPTDTERLLHHPTPRPVTSSTVSDFASAATSAIPAASIAARASPKSSSKSWSDPMGSANWSKARSGLQLLARRPERYDTRFRSVGVVGRGVFWKWTWTYIIDPEKHVARTLPHLYPSSGHPNKMWMGWRFNNHHLLEDYIT